MEPIPGKSITELLHAHAAMLQALRDMRLALLHGRIDDARQALAALQTMHAAHISAEESHWLTRLAATARWKPKVYLAEHVKLSEMILDWRDRLAALDRVKLDAPARLDLLDASLLLQHLLEHHFEREEKGLFVEVM